MIPRRQFRLPATDEQYLDGLGLPWETITESNTQWLLIHEWRLPDGYTVRRATVALLIPASYADAQIDMVYLSPPLARSDGRSIGALSTQPLDGKAFQRWSRHRTAQNPWRPGIDDVASHLALVTEWLAREFQR